jgi:hypothetical protein
VRPIRRSGSPRPTDFESYEDAKPELVSRLGPYCSYCERRVATNLAVEHIQPKDGPHGQPALEGRWENFLLACVNCNSTKGAKEVVLANVVLPDRDNTFAALSYSADGKVSACTGLAAATATLELVGLDRDPSEITDQNGRHVALDRVRQRMEAWLLAKETRDDVVREPTNESLRGQVVRTAVATGFFSVWMAVFSADEDMRRRLIGAFPGTSESECFDLNTGAAVTPAPNPDGLDHGGKV